MTERETSRGADRPPRWMRAAAAGIAVAAAAAQWPVFDRAIVPMDEGHLASAADWLLDGQGLYTDIHTGIFPGIYLITAGLFALFGRDLIVARLAGAVVEAAIALALFAVARRITRPAFALLPPLLHLALVVFAFPVLSMFNYSTLALGFGLCALVFLLRYLETGHTRDGVVLGLLVAAAALTKQNFGALVFAALWAGLALSRRDSALAGRSHLQSLVPIGAGGAALTLAVVGWLAARGTLLAGIDSTILSLAGSQMSDFDNPIPPLFGPHPDDLRFVFLYTPPALFSALVHGEPLAGLPMSPALRSAAIRLSYGVPIALVAASLWLLVRTRRWPAGAERRGVRAAAVLAAVFSLGILPSAIWSHLAFVTPPLLLPLAVLLDRGDRALAHAGDRARGARVAAWALGACAAVAIGVVTVDVARSVMRRNPHPLGLDRASVRVSERDRALYRGAVAFVDDCAAPGEPIVVLPDIPVVWFLTDRPNPSPYDLAIPGNVDGGLIAERIRTAGVRCIVMNPQMYPEFPPFQRLFPGLADAIAREFRVGRVIAAGGTRWVGLERRTDDGTAPEGP